jgi:3-hydroxybutyrate dehydrogenase
MQSRRILITGAGSGIGAGLAAHLARAGHHAIVTDLDADAARRVADEIGRAGGQATSLRLDIVRSTSGGSSSPSCSPGRPR